VLTLVLVAAAAPRFELVGQPGGRIGGRACTAVWGVFRQPDGTILASDIESGIWIRRLR